MWGGAVPKIPGARDMMKKGEGVERGRAEEDVHNVSTPLAPKPKKTRSGMERSRARVRAKAKADARTGGTRDDGGGNKAAQGRGGRGGR